MKPSTIRYRFRLKGGAEEIFNLQFEAKTLRLINIKTIDLPAWTRLDFHQCSHCPLSIETDRFCPLAANLSRIVDKFERLVSYDEIHIDVTTDQRLISQYTTAQNGISSIMGLMMATSGCPHTSFFRSMGHFHLPLSNEEETIYRVTGSYLLAQYFLKKDGLDADFELEGLKKIYKNMQILNAAVADRLRSATESDSFLNAITILDSFAQTVPMVIEESLDDIRYLFRSYMSPSRE